MPREGEQTSALRDLEARIASLEAALRDKESVDDELEASRALLNSVIDNNPRPMWISDSSGTLIRMNEACRRTLHVTDDEVIGKYNIFQDEVAIEQGYVPLIRRVFEEGETARFEVRYDTSRLRHLDLAQGAQVVIDVAILPVFGRDGKVTHAVIQHFDITERRRAEEALRENEERFRSMLETVNVGVWRVGRQGRTEFVNAYMAQMLGYEPREMVGRPAEEFVDKSDLAGHREAIARRRADQRETYERRFVRKDGRVIRALVSATPSFLPDGSFAESLATLTDITDREATEDRLRAQAEMLNAAPSLIVVVDLEGQILFANRRASEVHGYTEEEFGKLSLRDLDVPESAALRDSRIRQIVQGGEAVFEVAHYRKDGTTVPLQIVARCVEWAGQPAILNIATDITERKQTEAALAAQLRELQRWYTATLGRENRIRELKDEVNGLALRLGLSQRYGAEEATDASKAP